MSRVALIAHNVRSCLNVGAILRTAEGLGIEKVYLTGYTPYPIKDHDDRLPYMAAKIASRINKSALGAEDLISWEHSSKVEPIIEKLRAEGFQIAALEQSDRSINLRDFHPDEPLALIIGREVEGIEPEILKLCDTIVEIPMRGRKESFNVAVAAAIALYAVIT